MEGVCSIKFIIIFILIIIIIIIIMIITTTTTTITKLGVTPNEGNFSLSRNLHHGLFMILLLLLLRLRNVGLHKMRGILA